MKIALVVIGTAAVILGVVGIFLPLLPTTPFLLLAAACYVKASPKLYGWLINNKYLGSYIRNYREGKGIPLKTKIVAVTLLWFTISLSAVLMGHLHISIFLLIVAICVTIHILRIKTSVEE
jgi:uncharacterized membrane protein YbaN (DUF454 family)